MDIAGNCPMGKGCGKHPTQKPLSLLSRIILSSTRPGAWVFDPFAGSSTTGIAANLLGRRYLGMDICKDFLDLSIRRKKDLEEPSRRGEILSKLDRQSVLYQDYKVGVLRDCTVEYDPGLPF